MAFNRSVLAIAAHPDDIEFVMAGTMLQLRQRGWQLHYFNIANGCCGSTTLDRESCAAVRLREAKAAAEMLQAVFYPPICDDLEIMYTTELLQKVAAVVRAARPSIILTHATSDYMEDHQNAARLAVGGAFVRGVPNFHTTPARDIFSDDVALYHAQPHGNRDPLGQVVRPTLAVDVQPWIHTKRELLSLHASQAVWLDATQKMSSYIQTMEQLNQEAAQIFNSHSQSLPSQLITDHQQQGLQMAEGWRKHLHLGLSQPGFDPLSQALPDCCFCQHV
jgi:LmbE family N-acetylglucosaminyl deacetylase